MSNVLKVKSIHFDMPDGKKRLRVKCSVGNSNVQKTIEIDPDCLHTVQDLYTILQKNYPQHKIEVLEIWQTV
jgi:hypothetical protein